MNRVVILGRGGSGRSTLAVRLERATGLPRTELDSLFWSDRLEPLSTEEWVALQGELATRKRWILDGDLGPYDAVEPRLRRADTVVMLDLPLWQCAWRALRRGRERRDFWIWTIGWGRRDRPRLLAAIAEHAPEAELIQLGSPAEVEVWLAGVRRR